MEGAHFVRCLAPEPIGLRLAHCSVNACATQFVGEGGHDQRPRHRQRARPDAYGTSGRSGSAIVTAKHSGTTEVSLDFSGVDAVTPSFVDELLGTIEAIFRGAEASDFRLLLLNPPTRLSSKFSAIGRARGLSIVESATSSWVVTANPPIEL